ncbi:poly(A) RNA polymerase gld-2 homolog A isoform X4 [Megachile rotundata]|uniref:poly(A) RNA polymerase gld-2 homolog A isoform X4 n=1 Tax=Megachile rotundata TaxID=143995 RepID=UPI0006154275|nr:PREDICTED: poly(A) RNA polymerase gld-2 homolog A-like isoform X3 [Megachile rotundata]XP_012135135.1 PREDICTED: poly(A) RNA polymerase gld-2 homolog A-like isoform X3 [Megachile rotundata]XP_012135141.1 PREDICTED: poly(A) RNA polymerase gld-2 homolog A-like isoform X3 [Megachile rotundata]XP_012135149.1 PREDICTED: poly(A) RNA polymerase gld-2 homolog A-like isoform X3 [Megachile rotundata]
MIMGGQQANGQCPPVQTHTMHTHGASAFLQSEYLKYHSDTCAQNRHQMIQTGSCPVELLQLMGVEIPSLRRIDYIQSNNGMSPGQWQRRVNTSNNTPIIPSPHLTFRPNNNGLVKKSSWYNKISKRNSFRESFAKNEKYGSDSGFSSRSPTPNKYHIDSSQTESSDERDSVISSVEQSMKTLFCRKSHKIHSSNITNNRIMQYGIFSNTSTNQYYQHQKPVNYYPAAMSTSRIQVQTYQNKRRYHSGRNSPPPQRLQRNRKYMGLLAPNYNTFPRYGIAPDRFLARSHLVEVTHVPDELINGSIWDNLSKDVFSKFMVNQQTETIYRNKMMLWRYLYVYIKTAFPKYGLFLVGSTMNGFGSDNSDVDMCLLVRHTEMDQRNEAIGHLEQILKCLRRCEFIEQLELIQAKVPILKFHDSIQNLEVDLNCNNAVGIRNTHLLYCYSRIDWRVRPLVLVVKLWAQSQDINDAKNMTISSYSLVLMVIHFLQCGVNPPVLPCLHSLYEGKFSPHTDIHCIDIQEELDIPASVLRPKNRQSLGELFVEFFRYYVMFDFNQYAISIRLASKIPIEECRRARSYKNDPHQWKYLCIEEPFDLTNTARSVYDPDVFARIKQVFDCTYQNLKEYHDLSRIFVKMNSTSSYIVT